MSAAVSINTSAVDIDSKDAVARRTRKMGIIMMMTAYLFFSMLDSSAKWLGHDLPPLETAWARYAGASLIALAMVNPFKQRNVMKTSAFGLQLVRSIALFISTLANFLALRHLQLSQTVSIAFSLPLIVALLAGPMLGEWVGPRRLAAIGVGFLGILVVTRPGLGGFQPAMLFCFVATMCGALYNIWTRQLASRDSWQTTLTYSSLLGTVILTATLPFWWVWPHGALEWAVMILPGFAGAVGHYFIIEAHRRAPAAVLAPFVYTQIVWMVAIGYVVFGDVPSLWTLGGGAIVISSGLYLWYRERVVKVAPTLTKLTA
ncbi:MAG: DMT family transporter [Hyphomicrobiales bacterium]|nr:DMT family transporter [Hyphomicrobiales bacterium]